MIREKKQYSFLLPAVLTVSLILHMLPQTQAVLREIPDRLALVAEAEAKEPVRRGQADDGNAETAPAATGAFEDGVYTGSSNGYGGEITVQVTVLNGQITDITILSAPGETDPYFSLAGSLLDTVKQKQTWEVDTVSGATYSSRGILGAIKNALTGETVENEEPPDAEPVGTTSQDDFKDPAAYKDGTYYGTADGFGGSIKVEVVIKDGKIVSIRVIDASDETGEYLSRAKGVIAKILSKGSPNVDSVSGATYSSTGIINAVKRALSQAAADGSQNGSYQSEAVKSAGIPQAVAELILTDGPKEYEDGVYYGTADGFGGKIKVKVTVKKGKIAKISVESAPDETPKYLNKAKGVIPRIIKAGSPDVDTVSGATYSSAGIIGAVRNALLQAVRKPGGDEGGGGPGEGSEGGSGESGGEDNPGEGGEGGPGESGDEGGDDPGEGGEGGPGESGETAAARYEDGTYTGSGWCDDGEEFFYEINVTIRVEKGRISRVFVTKGEDESDSPEDNEFYLNWAVNGRTRSGTFYPGVPAQIISCQNAEVDTISGATYSSNTIRSIASRIISAIPVVESREEQQTKDNEAAQVSAKADLPLLCTPISPGGADPGGEADARESEDPANGGRPSDGSDEADAGDPSDGGYEADAGEEQPESADEAGEESAATAGEESADAVGEESADAVGEESADAAGEESTDAAGEKSTDAAGEESTDAADEESTDAAGEEDTPGDEEDGRPDAEVTGAGAGKKGGDGA